MVEPEGCQSSFQLDHLLMKSSSIASERTHDPIGFMGRGLDVSTSGFFAWQARQRAPRRDLDAPLRKVPLHTQFLVLGSPPRILGLPARSPGGACRR